MLFPTFNLENEFYDNCGSGNAGRNYVMGCDEVGVGPIAGPVVAAACVLNPQTISGYRTKSKWYHRIRDSKTTYEDERDELAELVLANSLATGIGEASAEEIDALNIHHAAMLAMKRACMRAHQELIEKFGDAQNICILLDGRFIIKDLAVQGRLQQKSVIDGDAKVLSIAAASILAKVHRDKLLRGIDLQFPEYGFAKHKGYATKDHKLALAKHGLTSVHRKSFC